MAAAVTMVPTVAAVMADKPVSTLGDDSTTVTAKMMSAMAVAARLHFVLGGLWAGSGQDGIEGGGGFAHRIAIMASDAGCVPMTRTVP